MYLIIDVKGIGTSTSLLKQTRAVWQEYNVCILISRSPFSIPSWFWLTAHLTGYIMWQTNYRIFGNHVNRKRWRFVDLYRKTNLKCFINLFDRKQSTSLTFFFKNKLRYKIMDLWFLIFGSKRDTENTEIIKKSLFPLVFCYTEVISTNILLDINTCDVEVDYTVVYFLIKCSTSLFLGINHYFLNVKTQ